MKRFRNHKGIGLLVIAFVLAIAVGVSGIVRPGQASVLSNVVGVIATPFRSGISAVQDWAADVSRYVLHKDEMEQQIADLEQQVADLEQQVRDNEEAQRENQQLRELLNLQQKRRDFVFESARVTARSSTNWESTLTLSKGSSTGVEAGDCVITETGVLVGVVSTVGTNWCTVSTVINTDIEMGGIVSRTYSAGVLEGDFALMRQGKLKLSYLSDTAQMVTGDEVVTSGKGDVYPSGLVVGQIAGVFTDASGMSRYAEVVPVVDLDSLVEVFIIKEFDIVE